MARCIGLPKIQVIRLSMEMARDIELSLVPVIKLWMQMATGIGLSDFSDLIVH